mmetsp:Transcript_34612/g.101720  ORF Transcript_34612/g.101720 Transcript_34612/m.101720 type:complete len:85 (-) Transcript_34612:1302-1556(-)
MQEGSRETIMTSNKEDGEPICVDCDKKTQKELPSDDATSTEGAPCQTAYKNVTDCMAKNNGQIGPCTKEWVAFKECHEKEKIKR